MGTRFNHLNFPDYWQHYWTKYPEGYSILEALLDWVGQVDSMVDNLNSMNTRLDDFINTFDDNLQKEVTETLQEWKDNGFLETIINEAIFGDLNSKINAQGIVPTRLSLETDWTGALERAFSEVQENGVVIIPQGIVMDFTEATVRTKNVTVKGGGKLKGKLIIDSEDGFASGITIKDIHIDNEIGLEVRKGRIIKILNNNFENCKYAILFNPLYDAPLHVVGMGIINANTFVNNDYDIYVKRPENALNRWLVNDLIVTSNVMNYSNITSLYADQLDGLYMADNFVLQPSNSTTKQYNVFIGECDWCKISDNHLSEAGYESIFIQIAKHINVTHNDISWAGQRRGASGVKIGSIDSTVQQTNAIVNGNNISEVTKHGIEFINTGFFEAKNNILYVKWINNSHYKGSEDLTTYEHYGVHISGNGLTDPYSFIVDSNICRGVDELNPDFRQWNDTRNLSYKYRQDVLTTATTLEGPKYDFFSLVPPTPTTIKSLGVGGFIGKEITLMFFNENVTIEHNDTIILHEGRNIKVPKNSVMVFKLSGGKWYEISRSFTQLNKSLDIKGTPTTIDVSNGVTLINLVLDGASTITNITGGQDGQEITIISFNANTRLEGANFRFHDGWSFTQIPSLRTMKFIHWSGKWYETSRSWTETA